MRKQILSLLIAVLLIFSIPVNASAASTKGAEKAVNGFMKSCKNYNPSKIKSYFSKDIKYSPYNDKYMNKVIKKSQKATFKYEIVKCSVKGKTAKVKVNVRYYDLSGDFEKSYIELLKELHKRGSKGSLDTSMKLWAKYFKSEVDNSLDDLKEEEEDEEDYEPDDPSEYDPDDEDDEEDEDDSYSHTTITLTLVKQGGQWKIKSLPKKAKKFMDAECSSMSSYINKHPNEYLKYFIFG